VRKTAAGKLHDRIDRLQQVVLNLSVQIDALTRGMSKRALKRYEQNYKDIVEELKSGSGGTPDD
jgi:hypothetical protein